MLSRNKSEDTVSVVIPEDNAVQTKRGIFTKIAKIHDPLGLASPTTLVGKLVYRVVCESKLSWDQSLPDNCVQCTEYLGGQTPKTNNCPKKCGEVSRANSLG